MTEPTTTRWVYWLLLAAALAVTTLLFFSVGVPLLIFGVEKSLFVYARDQILNRSGWNANLVTSVLIIAILPLFWAIRQIVASWSPLRVLSRREKPTGILYYLPRALMVLYLSSYFLLMGIRLTQVAPRCSMPADGR